MSRSTAAAIFPKLTAALVEHIHTDCFEALLRPETDDDEEEAAGEGAGEDATRQHTSQLSSEPVLATCLTGASAGVDVPPAAAAAFVQLAAGKAAAAVSYGRGKRGSLCLVFSPPPHSQSMRVNVCTH